VPLAVAVHIHFHRFHGSPLDYTALAAGAFASWVGVPGPGEPLLIAGGVLAAQHKLDLSEVLLVAWVAATAGGLVGWLIGLKAGRAVMTTQGPLHSFRARALERGDRIYRRWPGAAIILTTSWMAGIYHVRPRLFFFWNAVSAALWALGIGVGAFLVGPPIVDLVDDWGLVAPIAIGSTIALGIGFELTRRHRRKAGRTDD
jgi:membrane protein DedA with SNARE-associated domain